MGSTYHRRGKARCASFLVPSARDCRTRDNWQPALDASGGHGRDRKNLGAARDSPPGQPLIIKRLDMEDATLHLKRDSKARANWQWTDPSLGPGDGPPLIRSLSVPDAHVLLDDERRHLQFDGTVSAHPLSAAREEHAAGGQEPLQIAGRGRLNGRPATFEITGDPLATVTTERPYHFTFAESSSGSRLDGRGVVPQPFNFNALDATFQATGEDLKDLYYLTGVTLINTGGYRLSGRFSMRGESSKFSDLVAASGQSDIRGEVSIDSSADRPKLVADLDSEVLRLSDLGARAAGRNAEIDPGPELFLSNASLSPSAVRSSDGVYTFHARRLDLAHASLHAVAAKMRIDHGVLTVAPLIADVFGEAHRRRHAGCEEGSSHGKRRSQPPQFATRADRAPQRIGPTAR